MALLASALSRLRLFSTVLPAADNICCRCMASSSSVQFPAFPVLKVAEKTDVWDDNKEAYLQKQDAFTSALALARVGGENREKAVERHVKRNKKMVVEDRLKELLDDDSPFLELSSLAGFMMEYGNVPKAGMLTGIGRVSGKLCMIVANDGAFKGGTVFPVTVRKNLRAQEIALQNRLPCIYVVDSGGAFLPLQAEIFPDKNHGGRVFYNEAVLSAAQIPQIAVVCGHCTAGGAYIPTMADEAVIVKGSGAVFLGGPPLVKAALGEIISAEELGGATVHCKVSGCTDYFAEDEKSAFLTCRNIISTLNVHERETEGRIPSRDPLFDPDDLPSLIPYEDQETLDVYEVIARIVDSSAFHEFKQMYGPTLVTGFAHLDGFLVGIVGNQGELTSAAASKGAHFVTLCNERQIPIIFLQNTSPVSYGATYAEGNELLGDQLKCHARMLSAVSCCTVPRITVITGNAVGPDHYVMGGKATSPNFLFSWPNAVRCVDRVDSVKRRVKKSITDTAMEEGKTKKEAMFAKYMYEDKLFRETTAVFATSRVLDDGIIMPQETRQVLSQALEIVTAYKKSEMPTYSVIRM